MKLKLSALAVFVAAALSAGASQASTDYTFSILGAAANYSSASSINDHGQVSGRVGGQSVVWRDGVATPLGGFGGGTSTSAINNAGQVAGVTGRAGSNVYHATVWTGGVPSDLTPAATANSRTSGINNSGVVIGTVNAGPYQEHATRWDGNVQTDLGVLGGTSYGYSTALGINDSGVVVGQSTDGDDYRAVRWDGTAITKLGSFGGNDSIAYAVNNGGSIVGYSNDTWQRIYATVWNGTTMTKLGGDGGAAYSINDAGLVVGVSRYDFGDMHATLWKDGAVIDLNSFLDQAAVAQGWVLTDAFDVNNDGWIVGVATNSKNNEQHGFLLSISAVPEPETYAMLLAGLALVGCVARRRRRA